MAQNGTLTRFLISDRVWKMAQKARFLYLVLFRLKAGCVPH